MSTWKQYYKILLKIRIKFTVYDTFLTNNYDDKKQFLFCF